ncbi:MAG: carboxypeptidase-like regulatory domain-containing protein, partial [Phaeodactylibacter sp.]|nr:carboxypeptidase-like regulatory domain-containing protein [Phaeodactylibacter sp.]
MNKKFSIICLLVAWSTFLSAQTITGRIDGQVLDVDSERPIAFANIAILEEDLTLGTTSDESGRFSLEAIPVGRHQIQVSYVGYETAILNDVLITSTNNPALVVKLEESVYALDGVVVRPKQEKEKPLNTMASVSAKQLNMEEANRFAGGFDDPARLVTAFAGVAAGTGDNNAFSVRGNSPKGTLWQIEGIPVPNPNHFGEVTGFGGGGITALSSKTIGNSDFFMGAFPAEYGNALSSVFDLSIRKGSTSSYHHSLQVGFFGLDAASEGPFKKGSDASYLFNYRYSTLALFGLGLNYQDLSFKVHVPTKKG